MKRSIALILTAVLIAGLTACGKTDLKETVATKTRITESATETTESTTVTEETEATEATENTTTEITESTIIRRKGEKPELTAETFTKAEMVKLGQHTYYPADLFEQRDREGKYKDQMLSQLEEADKGLHDDVYVHGIGESEIKGKFRFFGMMMEDGVIYETADMTCWYDPETGSAWSIDYTHFRRTDFDKSGLIDPETVFDEIFQRASKSHQALSAGHGKISGTYLLTVDDAGRLFYRFTINRYSTVDVDAKTGEIIKERYWDGHYT